MQRSSFGTARKSQFGSVSRISLNATNLQSASKGKKSLIPMVKKRVSGTTALNIVQKSRPSSGCSSLGLGRLSSTSSSNAESVKKDLKLMFDRQYMQKAVKNLIDFLERLQYPNIPSSKTLMCPQTKDFANIYEFMYKFIDPSYTLKKCEEEMPHHLKIIGYPCNLSKSHVVAAGSKHSWPYVLHALDWFRQLLEIIFDTNWENRIFECAISQDAKYFAEYMSTYYSEYLKGANEVPELDEKLRANLLRDDEENHTFCDEEETIEQLEAALEKLNNECSELEMDPNVFEQYREHLDQITFASKQLEDYINNVINYNESKEKEIELMKIEEQKFESELNIRKQENKQLVSVVETQSITPEEQIKCQNAVHEYERENAAMEQDILDIKESIWKKETKLSALVNQVNNVGKEYNTKGRDNQMIPPSSINANNQNFEIHVNCKKENSSDLLKVKNNLIERLHWIRNSLHENSQKYFTASENYEKLEEMSKEQSKEIEIWTNKIKLCDEDLELRKADGERSLEKIQSQIAELQSELRRDQMTNKQLENEIQEILLSVTELKKFQEKEAKEMEKHKEELDSRLEQVCLKIMNDKANLKSDFEKITELVVSRCEAIKNVK